MWFLGKMVVLSFWLAFCRHPDNCTKGSQMECMAMPRHLSLNALVFVSWMSIRLNVKPRLSAKNSTKVAIKHFAHFITTELWRSKEITAFLEIWTAALHGHLQKTKETDETCLMIEIHLKAYAMKKNVIAELFLEINNGPFLTQQQKCEKANKCFSLGELYWCLSVLPWWLNLQVVTYPRGVNT